MGPCTANVRRPTVDSRCRGTTISCCVADLRRCLPTTSVTGVQQSTRYCAALPCRHLCMMTPSLYVTRSATSSQCKSVIRTSSVFTCIGALGTPSRTGPLARKYFPLHGPDRTRPDKVRGLCQRTGSAARVSQKSPVGSGRARVVEFSLETALIRTVGRSSSPACRAAGVGGGRAARVAVVGGQHTRHDASTIGAERRRPQSLLVALRRLVVPASPDTRDRRQPTTQARLAQQRSSSSVQFSFHSCHRLILF